MPLLARQSPPALSQVCPSAAVLTWPLGKLVVAKIGGFNFNADLVFGFGCMASAMAETICGAAMRQAGKTNEGKFERPTAWQSD